MKRLLRQALEDVAEGRETVEQALYEIGKAWEAELAQACQDGIDSVNYNADE
jgi:hypothetical protein